MCGAFLTHTLRRIKIAKVLLTLGDSWPLGAELPGAPKQPYGHYLKENMQFDILRNYGMGGASNEDTIMQLYDYIHKHWASNDTVTAIIHLTNPVRNNDFPKAYDISSGNFDVHDDSRNHWPSDVKQFIQELMLHYFEDKHTIFRSSTTLIALQTLCNTHNIADYYFSGWVKYNTWLPGVDLTKIWKAGKETAADWFGASGHNGEHLTDVESNKYIKPNFAHPNALGHQLIADKMEQFILDNQ
jgi:hypothetical protein